MKHADVTLSIIGGSLVVAVSLGMAIGTVANMFTPYSSSGPYVDTDTYTGPDGDFSPLATGEPAVPFATLPTVCPGACFTAETLELADPPLAAYYAMTLDPDGTGYLEQPTTTAADEHAENVETWNATGNMNDDCFFTWPLSPIVEPLDATAVAADPVRLLHGGTQIGASIERRGRVFADTESAVAHMATLDAGLERCHRYTNASSYPTDVVLREPAIAVPDSVAAVGWVRKLSSDDRYYVMDLQRANVVIRTVGYNNGIFTDAEFRTFMEKSADVLGAAEL